MYVIFHTKLKQLIFNMCLFLCRCRL